MCKDLNDERGEPPFLGRSILSEGIAGAKALNLHQACDLKEQQGVSTPAMKSARGREGKVEVRSTKNRASRAVVLRLVKSHVLFLLQIFSQPAYP